MWTAMICLFLSLGACSDDDGNGLIAPPAHNPADTTAQGDTIRFNYLALGDSYTIGTGLSAESGRFPVQLVQRLNAESNLQGENPLIIAQNGWTTGSLLNGIANANIDTTYSLVSLLIGVNNQFQNRPLAEYEEQFVELLGQAIGFAGGDTDRVFVVSIPDYGVTPFGQNYNPPQVAAAIDSFNDANRSITGSFGVSYYDITEISREVSTEPGMLAPDNLHPSGQQYSLWVDSFYEQIKQKLNE